MLTSDMLPVLACPRCKSTLRAEIEEQSNDRIDKGCLLCTECQHSYEILAGVPNLVTPDVGDNEHWKVWKEHLAGFHARRQDRNKTTPSAKVLHPSGRSMHEAFFEFANVEAGNLLDVGCGPGKLRQYLDESRTTYYGLDPLPVEDSYDFRFVHGLGEYIPFADDTFRYMLVISALDHFNDLDGFFREAKRVLQEDGRLLILQSTHDVTGPISFAKMLFHEVKDVVDSKAINRNHANAPKHMTEFTRASLTEAAGKYFSVAAADGFSKKWYSPENLFMAFRPSSEDKPADD